MEKIGRFFHGVETFFPYCGKIEVGNERIAVEHEHGIGGELRFDELQRAAGAQGRGLAGKKKVKFVGLARSQMLFQHLGLVAGGEQDAPDAVPLQPVKLPFKERPAGDGHEAFGQVRKLRGEARALASEQDDGLWNHGSFPGRSGAFSSGGVQTE